MNTNQYPKRLIEVDLPIKRISAHARREKSIRHGHISTLHIWWARRPLTACRAVICAALWPDSVDPLCPQSFRDKDGQHITKYDRVWHRACQAAGLPGKILHDCRRTAVRNMIRAGIPERVAMQMAGHKTRSVFDRYHIVSDGDLLEAAKRLEQAFASQTMTKTMTVVPLMPSKTAVNS